MNHNGDTQKPTSTKEKASPAQLIWGVALVLAGLGVFYRIPQVLPQLATIEYFAGALWIIRLCFYLMGIILIGGGARKILGHYRGGGR
jgi:phage shock protein PspC (stress-responsive transcriptional regulator)